MALIYSESTLEPQEVQESVVRVSEILNDAGQRSQMFSVFTDTFGRPCVLNLTLVTKICEDDDA